MELNRKIKALVAKLAEVCWDGGSLDGGELQEMLVEAGVLTDVVINEPCGKRCRCSEYDVAPPWVCYRLAEAFRERRPKPHQAGPPT
jgi:hypothetical protein